MANAIIGNPSLLISIHDPTPDMNGELPLHALDKLIDSITIAFDDIDPESYQDSWQDIIPIYEKKPDEVILSQAQGKKLWSFITKKRDPFEVLVIQDEGDRRAISMAYAICDMLSLKRETTIYKLDEDEWQAKASDVAPNKHCIAMVKRTRHMVVA
mgnify:CR=1 FL=1